MSALVLGVDPGKKGGLCLLDEHSRIVACVPMPIAPKPEGARRANRGKGANEEVDAVAIGDLVRAHYQRIRLALVEHQPIRGRQLLAVAEQQRGYGRICGALEGAGLRVRVVRPDAWKESMKVSLRKLPGHTARQHSARLKERALERARGLWPEQSWTLPRCRSAHDGMAEAALLAEYGRRLAFGPPGD